MKITDLPKYRYYKEVYAVKIKEIIWDKELPNASKKRIYKSAIIIPEEYCEPIQIDYKNKKPEVGGYYVIYKNGFTTFFSEYEFAEEFEQIE